MLRFRYAPSMPHWRPMMKQRPQITIVEPTIRTPACLSTSPKNLNTRPRKISPNTRAKNFVMSPKEAIQSFGTASQPISAAPQLVRGGEEEAGRWGAERLSFDHADFGVGGEQRLGEDVVEREDAEERDDD